MKLKKKTCIKFVQIKFGGYICSSMKKQHNIWWWSSLRK